MSLSEKFNRFKERFRGKNPFGEFIEMVTCQPNPHVDIHVEEIKGLPRCKIEVGERLVAISGGNKLTLREEWYPRRSFLHDMSAITDKIKEREANTALLVGDYFQQRGVSVSVAGKPFSEFRRARIRMVVKNS